MQSNNDRQHPVERIATGVKAALFVCVIGFIALMANRSLVAPGAAAVDSPAPSITAPDTRAPTPVPSAEDATATPRSMADSGAAAQSDGDDNHPSSF